MVDELSGSKDREELESFHTDRRCVELSLDPVRGNYDAAHLKEINRRIFQDLPGIGFNDVTPGQYRPAVPDFRARENIAENRGQITVVI